MTPTVKLTRSQPYLRHMPKKPKRKLTPAQRRTKKDRKANFETVFMNGKQVRVRKPQLIEGLSPDDFIIQNADPIALHQMGMWEYIEDRE